MDMEVTLPPDGLLRAAGPAAIQNPDRFPAQLLLDVTLGLGSKYIYIYIFAVKWLDFNH